MRHCDVTEHNYNIIRIYSKLCCSLSKNCNLSAPVNMQTVFVVFVTVTNDILLISSNGAEYLPSRY